MRIALLFPGQGAQYPGMGRAFAEAYATARCTFEESDELLERSLSKIIFDGPETLLTETQNSQVGIFVTSVALLRVIEELLPAAEPTLVAGLSLGEYTALHASGRAAYSNCLSLVQLRGQYMNDACEATQGGMAVVLGLSAPVVEEVVRNIPGLWVANINCPGQVVISGTVQGIEVGIAAVQERGAKRVLPLKVHGAFHSGLMQQAEERLAEHVASLPLDAANAQLVMNVTGAITDDAATIRQQLIKQVTSPVRWQQSIETMISHGIDLFVEVGCGKVLAGFNKRIGVTAPTVSIEVPADLETLAQALER